MSRRVVTLVSVFALASTIVPTLSNTEVHATGPVSVTALDTPYTENFDSLPAAGSATWTNNSTIPGWFHARTGSGTAVVANDGGSNAGNLYSYGTGTSTDRALGSVGSGNAAVGNLYWGVRLSNDTGSTITSLDVSYAGEQWRNSLAVAQTVAFSYLVGSPSVTGSLAEFQGGTAYSQLDFTSPVTGGTAAGALDGNLAANRVAISATITGLNIPPGSEVMLQWSDPDHTSADHGLAIDDFVVTAHTGELPPEPDLCADPVTPIHTLQGAGFATPAPGEYATRGIVVGDLETSAGAQGFYIQDPDADADLLTSEGIFVFTGGTANFVDVGDLVGVSGFVRERFDQTAIQGANNNNAVVPAANVEVCSTGNELPAATEVTLPYSAATLLEPYEGMRVVFPQELVISEYFNYDQFGEIVLARPLDGETRPFTGTAIDEPGTAANARTAANALSRITLDDARGGSNPTILRHPNGDPFSLTNRFRGGDLVAGAAGVLGYDFNLYRIYPTAPATYTEVNPRPPAPVAVGGTLHVAAMNTLNYFLTPDYPNTNPPNPLDNKCGPLQTLECRGADFDQPTELSRQRTKLLAALSGLGADVIGLNELENSPGVDPVGDIVKGLNDIFGTGTYAGIATGVIGTDAIKVGLIYKPASVTPIGSFETLTTADDPRFIDTRSRPTLAQTFEQNSTGERFTVAVNHLKSKGSACADIGDPDAGDGQGNCNGTRTAAAEALVDWLASDPTGSGDPDFLIMGDLNSYAKEDPIDAIEVGADDTAGTDDDFVNLIAKYQGPYAYSYTFDGQAGYLDHALANTSLEQQITGAADWHINSDEPDVVDYDTTFKPPAQEALYEPNGNRSSDHDPVMVGLDLDSDTPPTAAVTGGECSNSNDPHAALTVTLTDPDSTDLGFALVSNSNTSLLPNANVVVRGSGSARTIGVTAAPKHSGVATLTFEVSDATSSVTFIITVRVGTNGDETLTGTPGSDLLLGLGGRDVIDALAGDDVLCGANGDDTLAGGEGDDVVQGGKGADSLTGGTGADSFSGGSGADTDTDFDAEAGDTTDGT